MKRMNVSIKIDYIACSRVSQSGSFPSRGRKPEKVALEWWKQLKKETSYRAALEKVTADGNDITQLVKDLEQEEWKISMNDNLQF
jgi:hypothetical protein